MTQIFVVGMHRSGTSMVTGLLHLMGAWVGRDEDLIGANDENPKGFWERRDVISCNDAILSSQKSTWYNLSDWPQMPPPLDQAITKQRNSILEKMDEQQTWVIKDPRLCHTLPYWLKKADKPVLLIVHRNPMAVARSLQKRNGLPIRIGLAIWEACAIQQLHYTQFYDCVEIHYEDLIRQPTEMTQTLYDKVAAEELTMPSAQEIADFVDPNLNRNSPETSLNDLTLFQHLIYKNLLGRESLSRELFLSREAKELMRTAEDVLGLYQQCELLTDERDRALKTIREHEFRLEEAIQAEKNIPEIQEAITEALTRATQAEEQANRLHAELEAIKNSRTWKLRCKLVGEKT